MRIFYTSPVEGVVQPDSHYTHKYVVERKEETLIVQVINYRYLTPEPIECTITVNLNDLYFVDWEKVIGDPHLLKLDLPAEFIETIVYFYNLTHPERVRWTNH